MADLAGLADVAQGLLDHQDDWRERLGEVRERTIFNLGHGGEVAGRFLLDTMLAQQARREGGAAPMGGPAGAADDEVDDTNDVSKKGGVAHEAR